jgi:hypothetical protein
MYSAPVQDQPLVENLSKKEIFKRVYIKIANSLAEFNLSGKKFDSKLKKASKQFAKDIAKKKGKKKD